VRIDDCDALDARRGHAVVGNHDHVGLDAGHAQPCEASVRG
jgi:hypothetical protein